MAFCLDIVSIISIILYQNFTLFQANNMRCPGHTIQFLNYGYSQYIKKVLELGEINLGLPILLKAAKSPKRESS
jgi:hypothetical protein